MHRQGNCLPGVLMLFVLVACASAQQASAVQAPPPQETSGYTLQVQSQLVVLDVLVTDKKDANVRHLTADDFTVYENDVPQRIKGFEETLPASTAEVVPIHSTAELDRLEPNAPVSVIVLDELTSSFIDLAFTRYSLTRYLGTQGDTLKQPTMLIAANFKNVAVLQDYTTSRKELLEALEHHMASVSSGVQGTDPSWNSEKINLTFATLVSVAEATAGHPGHKNMIWIGAGFPRLGGGHIPADTRVRLDKTIATCNNLLRDARVTLYEVDPRGISLTGPPMDLKHYEDDPFSGEVDFDTMVAATGGRSLHGRNDVDSLIEQSMTDGQTFYTLSYVPTSSSTDAKPFRNIKVVMKDASLRASAREGYFTNARTVDPMRDDKGKLSGRLVFDVGVATANLLVYDGVPLTVLHDPATPNAFKLRTDVAKLDIEEGPADKPNVELTVVVEAFDRKGKMLDHAAHLVQLHVASSAKGMVDLPATAVTAAPVARVRFIVRDNHSGKMGAENFFLVDPHTLADPATGRDNQHAYK